MYWTAGKQLKYYLIWQSVFVFEKLWKNNYLASSLIINPTYEIKYMYMYMQKV